MTNLVLQQEKSRLNHILWNGMLGVVFMNSKTHMVVMEVVHNIWINIKNNGLISNLHEILSGQIWACYLVWFLINHGFMLDSEIDMVYTRHTREWLCIIAWRLDVYRQPICILQMRHMLLKWAVNSNC